MTINKRFLLVFALFALMQPVMAGKHEYKKAKPHADEKAWYVGSWQGSNTAFNPALPVEITILGSGDVYSYAFGQNKGYRVTQGAKVIDLDKLADTPMRGKMLDSTRIILEDGGKLNIAKTADGLQTTVLNGGFVVQYRAPGDPADLAAIQQRVAAQQEKEAHHKDNDFWHSEAFWGAVAAGAVSGATNHDDRVEVEAPILSQKDIDAINNMSTYNK